RRLRKAADLPAILHSWSSFSPDYMAVRNHLKALHRDEDPSRLIEALLGERFFRKTPPIT
ncbi:MAG TPA: hypothetical protein VJ960_01915, partial [Oceanipulchritudo sp.]|nr:hypothetical protein [Oceanipulchritudo sp.]